MNRSIASRDSRTFPAFNVATERSIHGKVNRAIATGPGMGIDTLAACSRDVRVSSGSYRWLIHLNSSLTGHEKLLLSKIRDSYKNHIMPNLSFILRIWKESNNTLKKKALSEWLLNHVATCTIRGVRLLFELALSGGRGVAALDRNAARRNQQLTNAAQKFLRYCRPGNFIYVGTG